MAKMKDKFTWNMFFRLFVPAVMSSFGLAFADMADALVVGQKLGATGLAAISLSLPVYMVINVLMHGFGVGGSVKYSTLLGEGKKDEALKVFNNVMQTALIISVIMAVTANIFIEPLLAVLGTVPADGELYETSHTYVQIIVSGTPLFFLTYMLNYFLRNDDNQKLASIAFIAGNMLDLGLNIVFVLVLDFGAAGAAWATLIGYSVSTLLYMPGFFSRKHTLRFKFVKPDLKGAFRCFATGFSTSVEYLMQMVFFIIANNVLMNLSGESGVAIFDMLQNASYLVLYLYDAAGKALQPLASTYHGEHNRDGKRRSLNYALICGFAVGITAAIIICIFPEAICHLFGLSEQTEVSIGSYALLIFCASTIFSGAGGILQTYWQSCDEERSAFLLVLFRRGIVLIPVTALCGMAGSLELFWWIYPVTEAVSLGLIMLFAKKLKARDLDEKRILSRTIMNKNSDIGELTNQVSEFCEIWEATIKQSYFVTMTIEEICLAIMFNAFDKTENGYIQVTLIALEDGTFELHLRDNATAFDPFSLVESEDETFNIEAAGMKVIQKKAKDFFYRRYQGFNTLIVRV